MSKIYGVMEKFNYDRADEECDPNYEDLRKDLLFANKDDAIRAARAEMLKMKDSDECEGWEHVVDDPASGLFIVAENVFEKDFYTIEYGTYYSYQVVELELHD